MPNVVGTKNGRVIGETGISRCPVLCIIYIVHVIHDNGYYV